MSQEFTPDQELASPLYQEPRWADAEIVESEVNNDRAAKRSSRLANAFILSAASASLIFEQSPANEALRTAVGLNVLESTGDPVRVGLVVGAVTVAIEAVPAGFISLGLHSNSSPIEKIKDKFRKKETELDEGDDKNINPSNNGFAGKVANKSADVAVALGLGAGLVTIKRHLEDPEPSLSKDLKTSAKATGVVAGVTGLIGYLAGGGIENAHKVGMETPAQYVVDYGTDTRFWMSAMAVGYGAYFAKKGVDKIRKK